MNLPNKITVARMVMFLPFLALQIALLVLSSRPSYLAFNPAAGLVVGIAFIFIIAMISDWVDGYLARKNNQVTLFGQLFDPLADKIITSSTLVLLSVLGAVPFYLTLLFIVRDLVVDGARNLAASKQLKVAAGKLGKLKTLLLSVCLPIVLLVTPALPGHALDPVNPGWAFWILNLPVIAALVLAYVSGFAYLRPIWPLLKQK